MKELTYYSKSGYFLNNKMVDILKIKAHTIHTAREWFNSHDYIEIQAPILIPAKTEWPNYLTTIIFNKKAHLSQGLPPYDQAIVEKLEKIYVFQPTFRLEKTQSKNHLIEYWRIEVSQKTSFEEILRVQEELIESICQKASKIQNIQTSLKKTIKRLENIKAPFQKIKYEQAIQILQKQGHQIVWGQTIDKEAEKKLSQMFDQPFFITELPLNSQTYFYKTIKEKTQLTKSSDLIAPEGFGELCSSAQRITNKLELEKKMNEIQVDSNDQRWYLTLMKESNQAQSGFAVGFERLIQWICKIKDIKKTTPYPRTNTCIYP
jgi:asparaginyl-tRNA synthetase